MKDYKIITKAWSFSCQSLVKFICQMQEKQFTGEEAVCARPGVSLACNNWPESSLGTSGCRSGLIIHRCRCRAKAIYHSLCLFPSYTAREKVRGTVRQLCNWRSGFLRLRFFCLAWFGLDAGQAFHVQLCWLAFFVDAGSVCLLPKAATLWLLFLAVIRMLWGSI